DGAMHRLRVEVHYRTRAPGRILEKPIGAPLVGDRSSYNPRAPQRRAVRDSAGCKAPSRLHDSATGGAQRYSPLARAAGLAVISEAIRPGAANSRPDLTSHAR